MSFTVALVATLALGAQAEGPQDAPGWRAQSESLYARGDHRGALAAALRARELDPADPWARYAWLRALAAVDAEAARTALPGLFEPAGAAELPPEEHARLHAALGYLSLDLGLEAQAGMHFSEVPAGTDIHPQAQAGLAMLSVRRGHARQALIYFVAARSGTGRLDPPLAELERETRYRVVLEEFATARDLRDANAAGRAYAALDELRPNHPSTLRARADLARLRGDAPARERALRDLLAVDRRAPGAAGELVDTLLEQNRPRDALDVARRLAPERLAGDPALQAIERNWVSHWDVSVGDRWREGRAPHDRLEVPGLELAWTTGHRRFGRLRIVAEGFGPDSDTVPAGSAYGSAVALAAPLDPRGADGAAGSLQWAPRSGLVVELGHTPSAFAVSNLTGALRFSVQAPESEWRFGFERLPVGDSLLSFAGAVDPVAGRDWGGVTRNRAYVGASRDSGSLNLYGTLSGALVNGRGVDENSQWEAEAGFWHNTRDGEGWRASLGGQVRALGYAENRSHFTVGHGGYFSPRRFLEVGPAFDLSTRRDATSFRIEGGVAWQVVREEASDYFPEDATLQAASGDPRYAGDAREGLGARLSASVEWRVSGRTVAGLRLEGVRGEDFDQVRLQVYARGWDRSVTEVLRDPPPSAASAEPARLF